MKVSASVYMTIQVEVYVGSWEAAQPFEQLHEQAVREAKEKLRSAFNKKEPHDYRIVGESAVMHVVTKEAKP